MQFMLTKKLQTIGLAALFLDEGEKSEDTVLKKKKKILLGSHKASMEGGKGC